MHLISSLVMVTCAAAYPLSRDLLASTLATEVGGLTSPPEIPPPFAAACFSGGRCDEPNDSGRRISARLRGLLLNALANRAVAVASQAMATSTTLPVIIPPTPFRTSLYPLPTTTQLPSHTQPESTAEEHTSIPATPHAPNEVSSPMATATVTTTATDNGDGSDSGSDPSNSTPTSSSTSNPSELGTIIGSVVGGVVFIAMIIAFIIMWRRT